MSERILVVEDEVSLVVGLRDGLTREGYRVVTAQDGEEGLAAVTKHHPDLIVLDVMMPKKSGFDVCKELRAKGVATPIIILTAKADEVDRIMGLELGADDYLAKPFSLRELTARIKAILRRGPLKPEGPRLMKLGDAEVDFEQYRIIKKGKETPLTPRERDLLHFFATHEGLVLSRDHLISHVWGDEVLPTPKVVDIHVFKLRQKLEDKPEKPKYFLGIHGVGYKFVKPK